DLHPALDRALQRYLRSSQYGSRSLCFDRWHQNQMGSGDFRVKSHFLQVAKKYHLPIEYTVLLRDVSSDGKLPYLVRMVSAVRFDTGSKLVESTVPALMLSGQIWCD